MHTNWILFLFLFQSIVCVDHTQFKTCSQSGFCNRNRILAENILNNGLESSWFAKDVRLFGSQIDFSVVRQGQTLNLSLVYLKNGAIKLSTVPPSDSKRYAIPEGDVVVDEDISTQFNFEPSETKDTFTIKGTGLNINLTLEPFSISLISRTDGEILKINSQNLFNYENGSNLPFHEIIPSITQQKNTDLWKEPEFSTKSQDIRAKGPMSMGVDISFIESKALFGIPEHATSLALKSTRGINNMTDRVYTRSDPYRLFNLDVFEYELDSTMALYGAIPIMLGHNPQGSSHRSVGVFWNNPSETWVDVYDKTHNAGKLTHWMSESGTFSLYMFAGKDLKALQKIIKSINGAPQLPPLFSLGYHQCRWNYKTVEDVLQVNSKFDEHSLPMDVIWLDIEHTDGKRYMTWHPTDFENPERMAAELERTGRQLVTIVDPHLKKDTNWEIYKELVDKNLAVRNSGGDRNFEGNCWPGKSVWTDYTNPEARNWWASLFAFDKYKKSSKNHFIWNDMNEPSVFNSPEITMPRDNIHHGNVEHRDIHNLYGMYQQMSTFKGLLERTQGSKRPFLLSRSFYAGSQRFGAVWTGDNMAEWSHLAASGPMLMSLGIVGYHFAGADVGGFFGNPSTELLVRWYQAGAMQPFFRAHAHIETKRREPWLFGPTVTSQIKKALRLRYSLLPVWYTAFEESSRTGVPPMRPMFLEFPDDEALLSVEDQWMVSSGLLFKPISTADQKSLQVILPQSGIWYDYFSFKLIDNSMGLIVEEELDLNRMLLYIKGGSIIPRKDTARRSSYAMKYDPYTLIVAFDSVWKAEGELYIDDGDSYEYSANQAYSRIKFQATSDFSKKILSLSLSVTGDSSRLSVEQLRANRIILVHSNGKVEITTELNLSRDWLYEVQF